MEEAYYRKIGENLKISLHKLYEDSYDLLEQIELGLEKEALESPIVGFQGVSGAFGEQATLDYFQDGFKKINAYEEFEEVLEALVKGEIDYGVLPIENSSTGEVLEVYDLMNKYNIYIVGEHLLRVRHNLLGVRGSTLEGIKEVYSHPQAFLQCKDFLKENKQVEPINCVNTAVASKMIAEEGCKTKASIGSRRAADLYELDILQADIHTNKSNYTKFIILAKGMEINPKCDKVSIVFTTAHTSGALYNVLSHFAYNGLNLLKIQSRPTKEKNWHYYFFVDIEGNLQDANVLIALGKVKAQSKYFRIFGNYKQCTL